MAQVTCADSLPSTATVSDAQALDSANSLTPTTGTRNFSPRRPYSDSGDRAQSMISRKRRRSKGEDHIQDHPEQLSLGKPKPVLTAQPYSSNLLTGRGAFADRRPSTKESELEARHTSPNPARKAISDLLSASTTAMSRLDEDPNNLHQLGTSQLQATTSTKLLPHSHAMANHVHASPKSTTSSDHEEKSRDPTMLSNRHAVTSPGSIDPGPSGQPNASLQSDVHNHDDSVFQDEGRSNKAFTYPGPVSGQAHRTASLPQSGYGKEDGGSPNAKRHKCPDCSTEFTRHHNLKSHRLTHSQEKPFTCDMCDSRFRRLHDLKRHTKLHTGERPHVCPKCDRSFARGDALARHTKGQGGCAGRRESMGSLGGDDRLDERMRSGEPDGMAGIMYTSEASHEPETMDEDMDSPASRNLPSIRRHDASFDRGDRSPPHHSINHSRQTSTYPPTAARALASGNLYPLANNTSRNSTHTSSPAQKSNNMRSKAAPFPSPSATSVFPMSNMTESPKPLSPGASSSYQLGHTENGTHHNRSPSISHHLNHQHSYRGASGNNAGSPASLLPPSQALSSASAPHLPPLQSLAPPEAHQTMQSQISGQASAGGVPNAAHLQGSPSFPSVTTSSANNSLSSHSTGPHTAPDRNNMYGQSLDRLWAYVESLAAKIGRLEEEVVFLKGRGS